MTPIGIVASGLSEYILLLFLLTCRLRKDGSDYFEDVGDFLPGPEPGCRAPPPEGMITSAYLSVFFFLT